MSQQILSELLDITSRVDERVKHVQQAQIETNAQLKKLNEDINGLTMRVAVLESHNGKRTEMMQGVVKDLELRSDRMEGKIERFSDAENVLRELSDRVSRLEDIKDSWAGKVKQYGSLIIQGVWVLIICYLLLKFGLSAPPIP